MESIVIAYIAVIAVLIVLSAFFSMSETAFTSANQVRLKKMAKDGDAKAQRCLDILGNYDKFLTTILIGNNLVNIGASSLATTMFGILLIAMEPSTVSVVSTVVMTVLVLICGEITPKTVAKRNPEKYAMRVCTLVHYVEVLFSPLSWLFTKFTNAIGRRAGGDAPTMTEDELEVMIDEIEDDGVIEESERNLIKSAIRFDDTPVGEVYVPRVDVVAIEESASNEELGKVIGSSGFSRIPVYRDSIDNIVGMVYSKEFYSNVLEGREFSIKTLEKPVRYVPETMSIATVLSDFQKSKVHMAVVLDSYGGTMGIVTMEDVLEELVGEIWDEDDVIQQDMVPDGDGKYSVKGDANVFDVMEKLGVDFDPGEYDDYSVSGYVFYRLGRSPVRGDMVSTGPVVITVKSVKGRRASECSFEIRDQSEEGSD